MSAVGMIFARGGSKGVSDKNIREAGGTTLLERAVDVALRTPSLDRVIVSTDSVRIADIALSAGAEVPFMRPGALAADDSPEWLAWQHALRWLLDDEGGLPSVMVSVPTTSPLRLPEDVEACMGECLSGGWDAVITVTPAHRSPHFNMVRLGPDGRATIAVEHPTGVSRRQDAPPLFDICTVAYAVRPEFALRAEGIFSGRVGSVLIPQERSLDIDTTFDLHVADLLLRNR